ncbi:MAG: NFACT family protein [Christensenellales bacterium]
MERCEKKIAIQNEALESAARMEEYRQSGELLAGQSVSTAEGRSSCHRWRTITARTAEPVSIPMDVSLSPAQNAQRYFKLYQKARGARTLAAEQKEKAEQELEYLEQMEDDLRKCTDARGLSELREMLVASGHVRQPSSHVKPRKEAPSQPMKFRSCDGIEMEVGKNALQNERLTMGARGNETVAARAEDAGFACADSHGGRRAGVYADAGGHARGVLFKRRSQRTGAD